jgi:hypothetical protein
MTTGKCAAALAGALLACMPAIGMAGVSVETGADGRSTTVARMPLAPHLSFKAHMGAVPQATGIDGSQPLWLGGAGLEYRITRRLVLGAGWEHHSRTANSANPYELGVDPRKQPGTLDPDRVTIGLSYRY